MKLLEDTRTRIAMGAALIAGDDGDRDLIERRLAGFVYPFLVLQAAALLLAVVFMIDGYDIEDVLRAYAVAASEINDVQFPGPLFMEIGVSTLQVIIHDEVRLTVIKRRYELEVW